MKRYTFPVLLEQIEQDSPIYDEGRRQLLKRADRFWNEVVSTAHSHHDPVVRAKLVSIIASAKEIPVAQRRAALEELLSTESHEIPLRSIHFALRFML